MDEKFYDPFVSHRWTFLNETIAQWDHLPTSTSDQPIGLYSFNQGKNYLFIGSDSIWVIDNSNSRKKKGKGKGQNEWIRIDEVLKIKVTRKIKVFVDDKGENMLFVGGNEICEFFCVNVKCARKKYIQIDIGKVNDISLIIKEDRYYYLVGGEKGLFKYEDGSVTHIDGLKNEVFAVAWKIVDEEKNVRIAVGTSLKLYLFSNDDYDVDNWKFYWTQNVIDDNITSLYYDNNDGCLWVGTITVVNKLDEKEEMIKRYGRYDGKNGRGLPMENITEIVSTERNVWFGTVKGICLYNKKSDEWKFLYQDRWIHGEKIISISLINKDDSVDGIGGVLVLSDKGASVIDFKYWNLEEKYHFYETIIKTRHYRHGLVSHCQMKEYGNLETFFPQYADSEGIWTGVYLTGEIFRYAHTKSEEAKKRAWDVFKEGIQFLNDITGKKGYLCRTFWPRGNPPDTGAWYNSTVYPDWQFKSNTSSDQISIHMMVIPLFYELVAETKEEKEIVGKYVENIVTSIVDNNYMYIDVNGKRTRWGMWNPKFINNDRNWTDERGLNSMQILSWLLSAYWITKNEKFVESYRDLVGKYGYAQNILNQKLETYADEINHSDDQLGFLNYFSLDFALKKLSGYSEFDNLRYNLKKSVIKAYEFVKKENSAMFEPIYCVIMNSPECNVEGSIKGMKSWPQELIDWPFDNSQRVDIRDYNEFVEVLPYNEMSMLRWNANPYHLKQEGGGFVESDPGAFNFGYWMLRYYNFIDKQDTDKKITKIAIH